MEMINKAVIFTFFITFMRPVSGFIALRPDQLAVNILDGVVIVLWKLPAGAPPISKYNVQMAKYTEEWAAVSSCTDITNTYCDLSSSIHDYLAAYKVRVQLVVGSETSTWAVKKVLPNTSELQPPTFTLRTTSSTLTVQVHEKPVLNKLFSLGLIYTIILEDMGSKDKTTTAYIKDKRIQTFTSLHWRQEYCVSVMVEGIGTLSRSKMSTKECLLLPEEEWFIIAVISLSALAVLGITALLAAIVCCYLTSSAKTPAFLISPVSGWLPLSVGEATLEVVTDKGWFLSSAKEEVKHCVPLAQITVKEQGRRTSMDSGLDVESNSALDKGEAQPLSQEDSGCGCMGGSVSSNCNPMKKTLNNERETNNSRMEDSGAGIGSQNNTITMSLEENERRLLKDEVAQSNYHRQIPSAVQISDSFNQTHGDSTLAKVVSGYRAGPPACVCSVAVQCTWCHNKETWEFQDVKQQENVCCVDGTLDDKWSLTFLSSDGIQIPTFTKNIQMNTLQTNNLDKTLIQSKENFPLLASLSTLSLMESGQDVNMQTVSLSLCDVQLQID